MNRPRQNDADADATTTAQAPGPSQAETPQAPKWMPPQIVPKTIGTCKELTGGVHVMSKHAEFHTRIDKYRRANEPTDRTSVLIECRRDQQSFRRMVVELPPEVLETGEPKPNGSSVITYAGPLFLTSDRLTATPGPQANKRALVLVLPSAPNQDLVLTGPEGGPMRGVALVTQGIEQGVTTDLALVRAVIAFPEGSAFSIQVNRTFRSQDKSRLFMTPKYLINGKPNKDGMTMLQVQQIEGLKTVAAHRQGKVTSMGGIPVVPDVDFIKRLNAWLKPRGGDHKIAPSARSEDPEERTLGRLILQRLSTRWATEAGVADDPVYAALAAMPLLKDHINWRISMARQQQQLQSVASAQITPGVVTRRRAP